MRGARLTLACLGALACVAGGSGCEDGRVIVEYEPYQGGPVYPSRRPPLPTVTGEVGYVSDNGSDTISILDLTQGKTAARIHVGRDPLTIDGPHHLAVGPDGTVFVALSYPAPPVSPGPHSAHSSSRRNGYVQKLAARDFEPLGEARLDPNPGEIVLSEDGRRLVASHFDLQRAIDVKLDEKARRATLAILSPSMFKAGSVAEPELVSVCAAPHGASLSRPDGALAYVACYGEDSVAIVDLANRAAPITYVPLGAAPTPGAPTIGPYSAVLSPSGKRVAVGNTESKDTRLLDTATRTILPLRISNRGAPYFAAWTADDAALYIPTQGPDALVVADAATGAVRNQRVFTRAECERPHEAAFGADPRRVYLVCEGDHLAPSVVLALDATTLETRATMPVGVYPDRLVIRRAP